MAIQRYELIKRHNPKHNTIDYKSPFTLGNGEFAFTADITGLQTLYGDYQEHNIPLCTMSQWGWHTTPVSESQGSYHLDEFPMTEYDYNGRKVSYAVNHGPEEEEMYQWLRRNPHRIHLGNIGLVYEGKTINENDLDKISQRLDLYEGILYSEFTLYGQWCKVRTACHYEQDILEFEVESPLVIEGKLGIQLRFAYGSSEISGADWDSNEKHTSKISHQTVYEIDIDRQMDGTEYQVKVKSTNGIDVKHTKNHEYHLQNTSGDILSYVVEFHNGNKEITNHREPRELVITGKEEVFESSKQGFLKFWETTGIVDFQGSTDPRAYELERRIILSLYLSRIQCCGSLPPQETGLTCNSWHGKYHLEMHLWHMAYLPLYNHGEMLVPTLEWYRKIVPKARKNAARNHFKGAKWPKQVAFDGIDSPSPIATLLLWQQPHIIYMLELLYQNMKEESKQIQFLEYNWELIEETILYMTDLVVYNKETKEYDLRPPVIPAQETHDPTKTVNPIFELEYWRFTLQIGVIWAERLKKKKVAKDWTKVAQRMAQLPSHRGVYIAHKDCYDTYEEFNRDHPMMLGIYGVIGSDRVDKEMMLNTLRKTMQTWNYYTTWGWDFAMMAMTATRLGYPDLAIDLLLMDTPNNHYGINGHNVQQKREDLPVYLPGNGSVLLAIALMTAGFRGCEQLMPGFPMDGKWEVKWENLSPFPY